VTVTSAAVADAVRGELVGDRDVPLRGISHDSGEVAEGWLFCAVVGAHHDGGEFAGEAVRAGAAAVLTQRLLDVDVPQILVGDVRASMADAARAIHHDPARRLTMVGVTGTNGKTTVVSMLGQILSDAGLSTATMGTLTGRRTTPESTDLQGRLAHLADEGITHVVMEVSSHALSMHRVKGVIFDVAVFTNLGRDHLDFHGTQEAYFAAKVRLFGIDMCTHAVINVDDLHGRLLADTVDVPVEAFGVDQLDDLEVTKRSSRFTWRGESVELGLPGRHNVSNALAAAETAHLLGVTPGAIARSLGALAAIPGRFEVLDAGPGQPTVVVDYAHTPDALASVLRAACDIRGPGGQVVVVFGCGGDRDRAKRPEMAAAAASGADVVVITTDNPRSEDPAGIIAEVLTGCDDSVVVEPDRRTAIALALEGRAEADVVVLAGKGHETGQEFADHIEEFDDRAVAAEILSGGDAR
jgi:UDP-N-acetylmuramoyl-L-alanyl-D-glutamate--2,6-diaminopimelate ligase